MGLFLLRRCEYFQGFGVGGVHGGAGLGREPQPGLGGVQALSASVARGGPPFQEPPLDQPVDGGSHGLGVIAALRAAVALETPGSKAAWIRALFWARVSWKGRRVRSIRDAMIWPICQAT